MSEIISLSGMDISPLLREIADPPQHIYVRGSMPPPENNLLAIVGSRRMSPYGKDACEHLIRGLTGYPISIVSGMALGIDTIAHRSALNAGLHTVAVLGSGLDDAVLYPRHNVALAHDILKAGGALVSEEEPHFKARPESFPKRNRIVTGMSHATLIIEAGERSGTLITAKLTVEYNRELLIVPHSIFSDGGAGGHLFMKLGGTPVRSAGDILEALHIPLAEKNTVPLTLTQNEEAILTLLSSPLPRDELIRALALPIAEANALLLSMELRGLVQETLGEIKKVV
jgi:DNA processing protein